MTELERLGKQRRLKRTAVIVAWVVLGVVGWSLAESRLNIILELGLKDVPFGVSFMILVLLIGFLAIQTWRNEGDILRQIRAHAEVLTEPQIQELTTRRFVIIGVSLMTKPEFKESAALANHLAAFGTNLDAACDKDNQGHFGNWQQPLRLVRALPQLTALFVIENSEGQFGRFRQTILHFRPDLEVIRIQDDYRAADADSKPFTLTVNGRNQVPDFEDFDFDQAAIKRGLTMISKHAGLGTIETENATFIDVTPGQKPLSIAAAIASIRRNLIFIYVTNSGTLRGYDVDLAIGGGEGG